MASTTLLLRLPSLRMRTFMWYDGEYSICAHIIYFAIKTSENKMNTLIARLTDRPPQQMASTTATETAESRWKSTWSSVIVFENANSPVTHWGAHTLENSKNMLSCHHFPQNLYVRYGLLDDEIQNSISISNKKKMKREAKNHSFGESVLIFAFRKISAWTCQYFLKFWVEWKWNARMT